MADQEQRENESEELLLTEELKPGGEAQGDGDNDDEDDDDSESSGDDDEETLFVFGDEAAPASGDETGLVKHLRETARKQAKRIAELERGAPAVTQEQPIEVGEKPTLEACEWDGEKFAEELEAWHERKRKAETQQGAAQRQEEERRNAWNQELRRYNEGKAQLGVPDVDEAEATVISTLDTVQQGVLVSVADDPARVMYALAKNPAQLADLAKISNPLKLAKAVTQLEGKLKVVKRRKAPEPEHVERGSARIATGTDKTLERLEKEANRTGDRTELVKYRKALKAQAKK